MKTHIGWLGGSDRSQELIDETLISADTYTGEVVRLTPDQLAIVKADKAEPASIGSLMTWLSVETPEEPEAFLADPEAQS